MPNEKLDYAALLADAEAKKAALEAFIAGLKSAMALGVLGQMIEGVDLPGIASSVVVNESLSMPADLPRGALHGKSIPQAIQLFLSAVKKRQTNKQITAGLEDHGIASSGKLEHVVTGALNRMRGKELLRFNDGWALASWYPENLRGKIAATSKPQKSSKRGGKKKKQTAKVNGQAEPKPVEPKAAEQSAEHRIMQLLRSRPTAEFSPQDVIAQLGMRPQTVHFLMGKMAHFKKIEKTQTGKFRASSNVREIAAAVS